MAGRILRFSRSFTTSKALKSGTSVEDILGTRSYDADIAKWKKLFFFVCTPALIIGFVNLCLEETPKRPEFKKYPYLRIRNKPYPWGDGNKSFFHNPHMNALPDGYETEDHH